MKKTHKYLVMLYQVGIGVVGFDNIYAMDYVQAVRYAMNEAFKMFPNSKFALHGYSVSDEEGTQIRTEKITFKGKI